MPQDDPPESTPRQPDTNNSEPDPANPDLPGDSGVVPAESLQADQPEPVDQAPSTGIPEPDAPSAALQAISAQLQDLAGVVEARLSYDKAKEKAFERLYAELDALKKNAAFDNIKPLLLDLILLYDRMEQVHQEATTTESPNRSITTETLRSFVEELLEILYRRDVELIEVLSDGFDPNQQRAIGVEDSADPAKHQEIARVVRRGFRLGSRTLRPEEVIVRRFVESTSPQASADSEGGG